MVKEIVVENMERKIDEEQIAKLKAMPAGLADLWRSKNQ